MRKVILKGNPNVLKTRKQKLGKNTDCAYEPKVVYPDLIFTLKRNPYEYQRPLVELNRGKLVAISNISFLEAVKEAGIDPIMFDLLTNQSIPLEQLMEKYDLEFPTKAKPKPNIERFLFFLKQVTRVPEKYPASIQLNPENSSQEYQDHHCLGYRIHSRHGLDETKFLRDLTRINGLLRSVNGISEKSGRFAKYLGQYR